MYDANTHSFCSEFYTIEKSIEVVVTIQGEADRIRIDALRDAKTGDYCTTAYIETHLIPTALVVDRFGPLSGSD